MRKFKNVNMKLSGDNEMDNQQLRPLDGRIMVMAKNAVFGDGYLWKHPECVNYKVIFTSTSSDLLEAKMGICPEIFKTGVRFQDLSACKNRYPNAKPLYRLASLVNPLFTEMKHRSAEERINMLTVEDFGLWYLDDGSTITRKDSCSKGTRTLMYIGGACHTDYLTEAFRNKVSEVFDVSISEVGSIKRHTPFTTDYNKVWCVPNKIAYKILKEASRYNVLKHKFPLWVKFRDHSLGEVESREYIIE